MCEPTAKNAFGRSQDYNYEIPPVNRYFTVSDE